jgi:hypothetical protein
MKAPRLIYSTESSKCCKGRALLVRSRDGGFVSRNCVRCGKPDYALQHHLPDLQCELCSSAMVIVKLDGKNYFYKCGKCGLAWKLADALPDWSDLFQCFGLVAPGDASYPG